MRLKKDWKIAILQGLFDLATQNLLYNQPEASFRDESQLPHALYLNGLLQTQIRTVPLTMEHPQTQNSSLLGARNQ